MIASPVNDLYYSFIQYIDHQICQKGQGFVNKSGYYYKVVDQELPNNAIYALPYKSMVYDSSISGATIPTGVWVNNVFCQKGTSGLKIDYLNSRAIFSGGAAYNNLSVSGGYAIKDFNIYSTTKSDQELVFETKYELNPSYNRGLSGINKDALVVPGIFLNVTNFTNKTNSFGGLCDFVVNLHGLIISDSKDMLDSVGNLLVDEKYANFPVVSKTPLNYYGDYKSSLSGTFNYLSYVSAPTSSGLAYIAEADFYKLSNKDFSDKYPDLKCALCDFKIILLRMPNHGL